MKVNETGDCFRAAYCHILNAGKAGQGDGMVLCHGTVTGRGAVSGKRFEHAWIEVNDPPGVIVRDVSNGNDVTLLRDYYYLIAQIDKRAVRRYSLEETLRQAIKNMHYGPWEDDRVEVSEQSKE